ncbi:MAG: virulence RhuM family protein [Phycisphaerae bacterium]|nr:virulence RhuM family protein [Phycisphaerae bacterium]
MTENLPEKIPNSEIIFYQTEDGQTRMSVRLENETVWLTQAAMAELFQTTVANINIHIRNVYDKGEIPRVATIKEYLIVRSEGNRQVQRAVKHYNLDIILAVGYRVNSIRGTQFRRWATERLREYIVKGFVLNDERLKEGRNIGADYFDELLERIRDIRASEKRFYQKIRDIYKLSIDYDPQAEKTKEFFQIAQNKLHWAIAGKTAAEIITERADVAKPNMGLTTWKGAKVRKADVTVAKNYLNEDEIRSLNRIVTMYLDYAEDQAHRRQPLYMRDWRERLDAFLRFNERDILQNAGKVSMGVAQALAMERYEKFNQCRLMDESQTEDDEFENLAKRIEKKNTEDVQ